ncbi:polyprenyl synthetase family protein [Thermogutta sp.]|uniref:polyprenyl synthetase family protein n=1 Tax=Thermogutta sp. TaxID=1962930 RepID=UPI003C7ED464
MADRDDVANARIESATHQNSSTIKLVPVDRGVRELIRREAIKDAGTFDHSVPLTRSRLERAAEALLHRLGLPRAYLGWTMVVLGSAFWQPQVMNVPYERRLLLLPHCMRNASLCAASYSRGGLACLGCGGCSLGWLGEMARAKGYRVLIAEGSPVVMRLILSGEADALLGVACLNSLERSLERILMAGIPCMAVPLLVDRCQDTATDEDWIVEMIETPYVPQTLVGRSYLALMRLAVRIVRDNAEDILPRQVAAAIQGNGAEDPLAITEDIGYSYLKEGGKYYRPFITLGVYDAVGGGKLAKLLGDTPIEVPDYVRRVALAVEVFHKASLIHDDIEDGDRYRYGRTTLHERWGIPIALNVGDYLIGLGYSAIASIDTPAGETPGGLVADLVRVFSQAHVELCSGQGAELWLARNPSEPVRVPQILRIYAMKTGPAFEVSILAGLRLAGPLPEWVWQVRKFAHAFGIAFQIENDLSDWEVQEDNKRLLATDLLSRRPTLFWALGWHFWGAQFADMIAFPPDASQDAMLERIYGVRAEFERRGVFAAAEKIFRKERERAVALASAIPHDEVRQFLVYLTEAVLRTGRV